MQGGHKSSGYLGFRSRRGSRYLLHLGSPLREVSLFENGEFFGYPQSLSRAEDHFRFFNQVIGELLGGSGSRRAYPKTEITQFAYIHPAALARDFVSTRY